MGSQLHSPVSGMKAPWPWHWSGHWALGSSQWSPPQPGLQWHSPFTQMPLLEHVGSRQSTALSQRYTHVRNKLGTKQTRKCHIRGDFRHKLNMRKRRHKGHTFIPCEHKTTTKEKKKKSAYVSLRQLKLTIMNSRVRNCIGPSS